jgi:hypothetical protein
MGESDIRPQGRTPDRLQDKDMARSAAAEPATARALWPTFMRRTLSEEVVRRETRVEIQPVRA